MHANLTLAEQEREAYQRGDVVHAELLRMAIDGSEVEDEFERFKDTEAAAQEAIDSIEALIAETNWRTCKKAELHALIETIQKECASCG